MGVVANRAMLLPAPPARWDRTGRSKNDVTVRGETYLVTHTATLPPAGTPAPDFTLHRTQDQAVSLRDLRGQPVILVFYPADWSPVCSDQLALYNEILPEFQRFRAAMLGISVDGVWCHAAFARDRRLRFPLLADFEPKGAVARAYGVYRARDGTSDRALVVVDSNGLVQWSYKSPVEINPGADGILTALETLTRKERGR